MSMDAMLAVFKHSTMKGNARLVLLAIANNANDDGTNAWPHQTTLAKRTGDLSIKTIQRCIQEAESAGELEVEKRVHGGRGNRYTVLLPGLGEYENRRQNVASPEDEATKSRLATGQNDASRGDKMSLLKERSIEGSGEQKNSSDPVYGKSDFERWFDVRFWETWPHDRRVGKKKARTEWTKLLLVSPTPVDLAVEICERTAAWVVAWDREKTAAKYIPHPERWLRDERWRDELPADSAETDINHEQYDQWAA